MYRINTEKEGFMSDNVRHSQRGISGEGGVYPGQIKVEVRGQQKKIRVGKLKGEVKYVM
jgi:hypothetical protein